MDFRRFSFPPYSEDFGHIEASNCPRNIRLYNEGHFFEQSSPGQGKDSFLAVMVEV